MLDAMSMDQLRTFIAAADEGSFSAAGRKLRRAQSVVSTTLANLELQVGFALFDRSGRYPQLTESGRALLEQARAAVGGMDAFKARARTLAEGLEPELAVAVDVMYPIDRLTAAVQAFHQEYPSTPLRLYVEALGAVIQPMLSGQCRIAVIGSLPEVPPGCASHYLLSVPSVTVVAPCHPLAALRGTVLPSTPSCAPVSAGAICRCIWCRKTSTPGAWCAWNWRATSPWAPVSPCMPSTCASIRPDLPDAGSSSASRAAWQSTSAIRGQPAQAAACTGCG
jgi:DNA-binding transcriptional LysR family regulator